MIYEGIDRWNSPYIEHYGVKGMKWGVRKQKPSLGSRYSNWVRSTSNKVYDRKASKIEARRSKRMREVDSGPFKNTKYGKWVKKVSNKSYDKERANIESRRAKRMREIDSFDNARSKLSAGGQKISNFVSSHKKEIAIGAGIAAGALAVYGAYKVGTIRRNNEIAVGKFMANQGVKLGSHLTETSETTFKNGRKARNYVRETASLKKSILGPSLNYERRNTFKYPGGRIVDTPGGGIKYEPLTGKELRTTTATQHRIGRNGEFSGFNVVPKDKDLQKYYRNYYKQYGR